ncbi:MAG: hypothetical protein K6F94_02600 [Bacteroidaceae bacterium]|nr:hypothetical protein [Bacteroidaceae bacterium]
MVGRIIEKELLQESVEYVLPGDDGGTVWIVLRVSFGQTVRMFYNGLGIRKKKHDGTGGYLSLSVIIRQGTPFWETEALFGKMRTTFAKKAFAFIRIRPPFGRALTVFLIEG